MQGCLRTTRITPHRYIRTRCITLYRYIPSRAHQYSKWSEYTSKNAGQELIINKHDCYHVAIKNEDK